MAELRLISEIIGNHRNFEKLSDIQRYFTEPNLLTNLSLTSQPANEVRKVCFVFRLSFSNSLWRPRSWLDWNAVGRAILDADSTEDSESDDFPSLSLWYCSGSQSYSMSHTVWIIQYPSYNYDYGQKFFDSKPFENWRTSPVCVILLLKSHLWSSEIVGHLLA